MDSSHLPPLPILGGDESLSGDATSLSISQRGSLKEEIRIRGQFDG